MANYNIIREICKLKGLTLKDLSEKTKISETGIQKILNSDSTKVKTLEKIAYALEIPISKFFPDDPNFSIYFNQSDRRNIEAQIISNGLEKYKLQILSDLNFIDTDIKGKFTEIDRTISSVSKEHIINLVFVKYLMKLGHESELSQIWKNIEQKEQIIEDKQQIIEFLNEKIKSLKEQSAIKS